MKSNTEWTEFTARIQEPSPAIDTFTNQALMMIYLMFGRDCLRPKGERQFNKAMRKDKK